MVKKIFKRRHPLPVQEATLQKLDNTEDLHTESFDEVEELSEGGNKFVILILGFLIVLGMGTGFVLARRLNSSSVTLNSSSNTVMDAKKSVGVSDLKAFPDSATGVIEEGGVNGEGTHKLVRDGGPSQTVYMISSVVDLDQFIGKKVTIWGQTMGAKKVAWLMDVGRVDVE